MSVNRLDTIFGIRAEVDERSITSSRAQLERLLQRLEKRAVIRIRFVADNQIRASLQRIEEATTRTHRGVTRLNAEMLKVGGAAEGFNRASRAVERFGLTATRAQVQASQGMSSLTARTDAQAKSMGRLGDVYSRTFSRLEFLLTALIAGFATDVIVSSAKDFAALDAQLRGTEIAATRAGLSYDDLIGKLTTANRETGNFALRQKEAADALNKLLIGGLQPTAKEIERQKQIALGAATLFGEDPSKLFERFSAAGLRQSTRILDDLGIVLRVKQAQEAYAESLGKTAKELTALEKNQAFYKAALQATGTEALIAASKLETPFLVLERAENQIDRFRLALGSEILSAILPTAQGINEIKQETIDSTAEFIVFTARVAGTVAALRGLDLLLTGLTARMAAFRAAQAGLAATDGLLAGGGLTGTALRSERALRATQAAQVAAGAAGLRTLGVWGLIAGAVLGVVAAFDDYNQRLQDATERQTDFVQTGLKMQQFLQTAGFGTSVEFEANQTSQRLLGAGASPAVASTVSDVSASATNLLNDLEKQADAWESAGVGADGYREAIEAAREQVTEMITRVEEGAKAGVDFGDDMKGVSDIIDSTLKPTFDDLIDQYEIAALAAEDNEARTRTWVQNVGQYIVGAGALIQDMLVQLGADFSAAVDVATGVLGFLAGKAVQIAGSVASTIGGIFNSLVDSINGLIGQLSGATLFSIPTIGLVPGAGPFGLPGIAVTGSKAVKLPSTNFRLSRVDASSGQIAQLDGASIAAGAAGQLAGGLRHFGADGFSAIGLGLLTQSDFSGFGGGRLENFFGNFTGGNQRGGIRDSADQARALLDELTSLGFDTPDGGPAKKGGGGGGGKKSKAEETREEIFKKITERLNEQLALIEAERDTQVELLELGSLTAEEEIKRLDIRREQTKIDALIEIKAQDMLDLLAGEETLRSDLIASLSAIVALEDDRREKLLEAVEKSNESLEQLKIETELKRLFGEEVDASVVGQKAINELIDLYAEFGQEALDEWKKVPGNVEALNQGLEELAREQRKQLLEDSFNFQLGGLSFANRLAAAREPDANRDAILGYNATLNELTATMDFVRQQMDEGFLKAGDENAVKFADTIRDLIISMEEQITAIDEGGFLLGTDNKAKLDEARNSLSNQAIELANSLSPDPLGLSQATSGFSSLASVAAQFATKLAAGGNALLSAVGGATGAFGGNSSASLDQILLNNVSLLEGSAPGGGPLITGTGRFQQFQGFKRLFDGAQDARGAG